MDIVWSKFDEVWKWIECKEVDENGGRNNAASDICPIDELVDRSTSGQRQKIKRGRMRGGKEKSE